MSKAITRNKYDLLGTIASAACLVHCLLTPIIFVAKACSVACCASPGIPIWWKIIDFLFLVISLIAILYVTKKTIQNWLKLSFWAAWFLLLLVIINDSLTAIELNKTLSFMPAIAILFLHAYNIKYCNCKSEDCRLLNKGLKKIQKI